MTLNAWSKSDVGLKRDRNEDSCFVDDKLGLFVVADGMGGHRGGEVASRMAVDTVRDVVSKGRREAGNRKVNARALLIKSYEEASKRIYNASQSTSSALNGMGTTLVAAIKDGANLLIGNVGDSRAYLFTQGKLWQLTEDHSLVNEQIRAGIINEKDLERLAPRNVITRSVGFEPEVQADMLEYTVNEGDLILLCSDGLSGLVSDQKIAELCRRYQASELVSVCIDEAKKAGGDDNITVVVIYAGRQEQSV